MTQENILFSLAQEIKDDLMHELTKPRQHLKHKGLTGSAVERELVETFFKKRYPFLSVAGGEIIGANGFHSHQVDIILYDQKHTPQFYKGGNDIQVIPIEGVLGIVEVKSFLSGNDLREHIKKSESFKKQPKLARWSRLQDRFYKFYGATELSTDFPIQTIIFAMDSISHEAISKILVEEYMNVEPKNRINFIYILNKGLYYIDPMTNELFFVPDPVNGLFIFYTQSYSMLSFAEVTPIRLHSYGGDFSIHQERILLKNSDK